MRTRIATIGLLALASGIPIPGRTAVMAYPSKGQSPQQEEQDKFKCYQWAKNQTGIDPRSAAGTSSASPPPPQGGAVKGATKGAAVGVVGGAIAGNVGAGAAIGAGVGAVGGGMRRRAAEEQAAQQQQQAQAQQQQTLAKFDQAEAVCLKGKGYTVD